MVVSYLIDEYGAGRPKITALVGSGLFLLGVPVAPFPDEDGPILVTLYDTLAANILLVTGSLLLTILVAWINADRAVAELRRGTGGLVSIPGIWLVRVPVVAVLLVSPYLSVATTEPS